jgi:hypothetical protein
MDVNLLDRASVALEHSLGLAAGHGLVVVSDTSIGADIRSAFVAAGRALGATPTEVSYSAVEPVAMREFGKFAAASLRAQPHLPPAVVAAIAAADAAVILNADMAIIFDEGLRTVIGMRRTRLAWAPYLTTEGLLRLFPASRADCVELLDRTNAVAAVFAGRHHVRVSSPAGTALELEIGAHRINCGTGISASGAGYGGLEIWPGGQVSTVPDAGTARGRVVIDRSLNAPVFKELTGRVELLVEDGAVVRISGDNDARELRSWLASLKDPNVYHLTELGVGTNRQCTFAGVAAPCEDTHTLGCVSLALGADVHLGGNARAGCHVDMTMRAATLEIDDQVLVAEGGLNL